MSHYDVTFRRTLLKIGKLIPYMYYSVRFILNMFIYGKAEAIERKLKRLGFKYRIGDIFLYKDNIQFIILSYHNYNICKYKCKIIKHLNTFHWSNEIYPIGDIDYWYLDEHTAKKLTIDFKDTTTMSDYLLAMTSNA